MTETRVALVSGASRGIGAATAREFARQGWRLSLGMRDPRLPEWADPALIHIHAYDAAGGDLETRWVTAAAARFGRIDAIVASAGICSTSTVIEAEDDELDRLLEINCKAPRRLVKAAWNALTASGRGRVIILGSLSGKRVKHAGSGLYSMTKFAAVALAHGIRHAGFDVGIRATAVCPGLVDTDMARALEARAPADMTDPADLARIIAMLVDLPNEASVAEFTLNCQLEEFY
ncbi:MAG: SDR family NAD(P)-dependent oxidoreductase [Mesorhizobium sp.]|uniref:SDR family NAD(P)-dependent oxidoreductase n=1 Tax=Mesorhizobium sp. TaxID=1871066 RepID=UPI0011FF42A7|nr:SDR family NAD(P)-dependent oxidoreductase [Mesorhizobium sp.]TIM31721.1 MAG: SDR family NAD(P)-dependent oxidoreductase [Mesorhizobium sp.]